MVWEGPMCFRGMMSVLETIWNVGSASEASSITIAYRNSCGSGRVMVASSFSTCYSRVSTKPERSVQRVSRIRLLVGQCESLLLRESMRQISPTKKVCEGRDTKAEGGWRSGAAFDA